MSGDLENMIIGIIERWMAGRYSERQAGVARRSGEPLKQFDAQGRRSDIQLPEGAHGKLSQTPSGSMCLIEPGGSTRTGNEKMVADRVEPSEESPKEGDAPSVFDNYRSLIDHSLLIFVEKDVVPPFRFKAGGWELVQSSIELGPGMTARIREKGFFMCRANEDQSSWTELTGLQGG